MREQRPAYIAWVVCLPVIGLVRARRVTVEVLAIAAVATTIVATVRAGPPGWDGPFPESGAMVRLYSEPLTIAPADRPRQPIATAVRLTLIDVADPPPAGVEVFRDGFAAEEVGVTPAPLMVHAGDVLTLVNGGPRSARIRLAASSPLLDPAAGPWVVPAHASLRLPAVTVAARATAPGR